MGFWIQHYLFAAHWFYLSTFLRVYQRRLRSCILRATDPPYDLFFHEAVSNRNSLIFLEVIQIQIRRVDPSYLNFLRAFEPQVPLKDRPYLWPVMLDGITFGIPLTTQDTSSGYPGYLRSAAVPENGLNLRYMIPLPEKALLPAAPLTEDLKAELEYYEDFRKYIESEAQILYRLSDAGQMHRPWQRHSCDFQELNSVYYQWTPGFDAGLFSYPKKEDGNMPISKNGKTYYTKAQYEAAKYNSNALEYARSQGYNLVKQGAYYTLKEHDSMIFAPNGSWFWNSRGVHGSALEFQIYYEGKTVTEAVLTLAGEKELVNSRPQERRQRAPEPVNRPQPEQTTQYKFQLPDKADNFKQLFYYLCNTRKLEKSVVQEMIKQNSLYQSVAKLPNGKAVCNATFIYKNPQGQPVGAFQRGMSDREGQDPYKRDAPGSNKRWGWLMQSPFNSPTEVRVFEGAIDAASEASLYAISLGDKWREVPVDRLSLEGVGIQPLLNYLQNHPDVRKVTLMLDGDVPGRRAAQEISDKLTAMGYEVEDVVPALNQKDWNESLKACVQPTQAPTQAAALEPEM